MSGLHKQLSPLNFRGLLASAGVTPFGETAPKGRPAGKRRAIECWRCPECQDVHDWEDEAEECCAEQAPAAGNTPTCPICTKPAADHRDAADCCLWKDLGQAERYAAADAVAAGQSWLDALGLNHLGAPA